MKHTNVRAGAVRSRLEACGDAVGRLALERARRVQSLLIVLCALLTTQTAAAQQASPHAGLSVTVLRSSGANTGGAGDAVDAALLRDLPAIAGIDHAQLSPVEYEEIQLTVGCSDQSRDCLAAIAGVAQVSGLIVRSVAQSGDALQLELVYFDASSQDEPSHAAITGSAEAVVAAVPSLVRKLFGIPEVPVAEAAPTTTNTTNTAPVTAASPSAGANDGLSGLAIAGIVTAGAGVAVVLAGALVGMSASGSFDDYKKIVVTDRESAQRASDAFDSADSKATVANVLMPVGGALIVGGAVLFVLGLNGSSDDASATTVSLSPTLGGGMMTISGAL